MRVLIILLVHLIATLARLMGPGGLRSVVAESLLVNHQLLILNRSRQRSPNRRAADRIVASWLFMRPSRVIRSATVDRSVSQERLLGRADSRCGGGGCSGSSNGSTPGTVVATHFVGANPTTGDAGRFFASNQGGTIYQSTTAVAATQTGAPAGATPIQ